jgi:regulator of sirC expression with transglutaminase-like and TPR domain
MEPGTRRERRMNDEVPEALAERFARFRSDPDASLFSAAELVARCDRPAYDAEAVAARLDALASDAAPYAEPHRHPRERVEGLCCYLKDVAGFHGDAERYYERENSWIDVVLERRRGIPISLAAVYAAVGAHLGLDAEGVNFPGHFLLRMTDRGADEGALLVDPFAGRVLSRADCSELLSAVEGAPATVTDEHLRPASALQVLVRMLNNLKQLAMAERALADALRYSALILAAEPDLVLEHRDRAALLEALARPGEAATELELLLIALAPGDVAEQVRVRIEALRARADAGRIIH